MRRRFAEAGWLAICAGILVWKLLLPGFIGMADNGDFGKVAGPLCLASAAPERENFFHALYLRAELNCVGARVPTSELVLAGASSGIERVFGGRTRFDIRWLGALHALIFLAFYAAVLMLLRPLGGVSRSALSLLALWIFADIGLLAYFNSFYSDTAAALGGLTATVLAMRMLSSQRIAPGEVLLFGAATMLLVTSKAQHGWIGPLAATLPLAMGRQSKERRTQLAAAITGVALIAASIWILWRTPSWYRNEARFDVVFLKIARNSPSPGRDLAELGLAPEDARYIGMNSYSPGGPMSEPGWADRFGAQCTDGRVMNFYLTHPGRVFTILWNGLVQDVWQRRDPEQSNFSRGSGRPEGALATSLGSWSEFQTRFLRKWPGSIALWLVLWPAAAFRFSSRGTPLGRPIAWTSVALSLAASGEFVLASLTDAVETPRHLLLFHVYTDLSVFLGLVFAADWLGSVCPSRYRRPAAMAGLAGLTIFLASVVRYEVAAAVVTAPPAVAPADAVDDTNPAIVYSGKWRQAAFGSAFHGTLTFTDQREATAHYSFTGSELQYFYTLAPNRGLALITIDGAVRREIDLYAPQIVWQARAVFGNLTPGVHEVEVKVLGRHNSHSSGDFVDIDAFAGR